VEQNREIDKEKMRGRGQMDEKWQDAISDSHSKGASLIRGRPGVTGSTDHSLARQSEEWKNENEGWLRK